ncbi:MAG: ribonuclease P protein component [bacterium]
MKNYRFGKKVFIKKKSEFNEIFNSGKKVKSNHIVVFMLPSRELKIGFAVAKSIKGAVKRNRAKRRLKVLVRSYFHKFPQRKAIVVVARPGILDEKFQELDQQFVHLLSNLCK